MRKDQSSGNRKDVKHHPMKYITSILFVGLLAICLQPLSAQETDIQINKNWDHERHSWQAAWVTHPEASVLEYGVFLFRNEMQLDRVPDSLIVHLSADNRYRLWVNGKMVCSGPAKGSFMHWRYETLDLSPWLKTGKNVLAAEVFNMGEERPAALYSRQTALILQADGHPELNTPGSWQVMQDLAWQPIPVSGEAVGGYYVAGPTDRFEAGLHPWGWKEASYVPDAAGDWKTPRSVQKGVGRGYMHGVAWMLVPRSIPLMENKELRFQKVVRYTRKQSAEAQRNDVAGGQLDTALFLEGKNPWLIPANDTFRILLDQGELTLGYPVLHFEGGRGSQVRITYAESLRHPDGSKGNRSETEGKQISGYHDLVLPDGEKDRSFQSLWLRTWRYVQLDIVTGDEPLTLNDFHGIFEAYPFHCKGAFRSSNPQHEEIWEVGWRTARLCANGT